MKAYFYTHLYGREAKSLRAQLRALHISHRSSEEHEMLESCSYLSNIFYKQM